MDDDYVRTHCTALLLSVPTTLSYNGTDNNSNSQQQHGSSIIIILNITMIHAGIMLLQEWHTFWYLFCHYVKYIIITSSILKKGLRLSWAEELLFPVNFIWAIRFSPRDRMNITVFCVHKGIHACSTHTTLIIPWGLLVTVIKRTQFLVILSYHHRLHSPPSTSSSSLSH